jgi:hypothetical protein
LKVGDPPVLIRADGDETQPERAAGVVGADVAGELGGCLALD